MAAPAQRNAIDGECQYLTLRQTASTGGLRSMMQRNLLKRPNRLNGRVVSDS